MYISTYRRDGSREFMESTWVRASEGAGVGYPGPFEITIDGATATLTDCVVQRQMCYVRCGDENDESTVTVDGVGTEYIYVEVEDSYGVGTAGHGEVKKTGTASDAYDAAPPEDQSVYKFLLYWLDDGVVACDYRKTPQMGAQA